MNIYLIAGYAGSGKTTMCVCLTDIIAKIATYIPLVTAFAVAVKDDCASIHKIPRILFETQEGKASVVQTSSGLKTLRQLMIEYSAAEKTRTGNSAIWAERVADKIATSMPQDVIIHDWRYKLELECLKSRFPTAKFHTIRVVRKGVVPLADPSEHDLDSVVTDYILQNDDNTGMQIKNMCAQLAHQNCS